MKLEPTRRTTLVAYVDESGDTGSSATGGTAAYALGCVVIDADTWLDTFDSHLELRRRLKLAYGLPVRTELKANYLIRSSGPLKALNLPTAQRHLIYRACMRWMATAPGLHAFATVTHKSPNTAGSDLLIGTWTPMLQRLSRTTQAWHESNLLLVHDNGENDAIRKLARKSRRYLTAGQAHGSGSVDLQFKRLIDDPQPKDSQQSYMLQMADLVAYAGWRRLYKPGSSVAGVVHQDMWSELGAATLVRVNSVKLRTAPGVVEVSM